MEDAAQQYDFQKLVNVEEDIEVIYDMEAESLRTKKKKRRRKAIVALLVFGLLIIAVTLLAIGGLTTGLVLTRYHYPDPPPYVSWSDMRNSVEYQITLGYKEDWFHRDSMLTSWVDSINEFSSYINIAKEEGEFDIYLQYHYMTEGRNRCRSTGGLKARYRAYIYGKKYTLDIKKDEELNESCNQPYWPAEEYYDTVQWKCEEDVHPCFMKYNMESRVTFYDPWREFNTCADLVEVFPDAFPKVDDDNKNNKIKKDFNGYWYKLQWRGEVGEYTSYEITFTILYDTMMDAVSGTAMMRDETSSEFSLRYYVPNGKKWEPDVIADFQNTYYSLVQRYDIFDQHHVCADKFFQDESLSYIGVELDDQL